MAVGRATIVRIAAFWSLAILPPTTAAAEEPPLATGFDAGQPAGTATIWVVGVRGRPLPGAGVTLVLVDAHGVRRPFQLSTTAQGWVRVSGLRLASLRGFTVARPGGPEQQIIVEPGRAWGVRVEDVAAPAAPEPRPAPAVVVERFGPPERSGPDPTKPAGTLTVWVVAADAPVPDAPVRITLRREDGDSHAIQLTTGPAGFLRLHDLPTAGLRSILVEGAGTTETVRLGTDLGQVVVLRPPGPSQSDPSAGVPETPSNRYRRGAMMKVVGQVLTLLGAACGVASGGFVVGAFDGIDLGTAVLLSLGALTGLGAGIPLWVVGDRRMGQAEAMGYVPTD